MGGPRLHRQPVPRRRRRDAGAPRRGARAHRAGRDPHRRALVAALATSRVLVPIMAVATETGATAHGLTGDNGADMAMVSITAPDGTTVPPLFTSVDQLSAWRGDARPVPVVAPQAAQAAVQEGRTAPLLDAATPEAEGGPVLPPRSVLWALAQGREWIPPHEDGELAAELERVGTSASPAVLGLAARAGERAEVDLHLRPRPGADRGAGLRGGPAGDAGPRGLAARRRADQLDAARARLLNRSRCWCRSRSRDPARDAAARPRQETRPVYFSPGALPGSSGKGRASAKAS
ncbi:SseB family protein [Brachybacterium sp. GPGPB12]|uniref:SseB family protein n=1 Tax=Brachybacterium sp. GPGPB12 TaxID=3023517 RepID=UPI0031342A01